MNQEQNNLNPNNFNTQGNNRSPNNQNFNQSVINNVQEGNSSQQQTTNTFQGNNLSVQSAKSKMPKKLNIGLIVGIVTVVAAGIGCLLLFNNNNEQSSGNNVNFQQEKEEINVNNDTLPQEIIKVVSDDANRTYLLSTEGKIYFGDLDESNEFVMLELDTKDKVVDINNTGNGLLFKLENGEFYLINKDLKSDKEIPVSQHSSAKRIMLDNIVQYAIEDTLCNYYLFLTKDGELFKLNFDKNSETNVEKVMDNVKKIEASLRNAAIIDNNNIGYVLGYNVKETGILGTSDVNKYSSDRVCTPTKIGENIKELDVFGWNLMYSLHIYYINQNNELYVIGQSANNNYFMGKTNNFLKTPTKLYDNVKDVHATANSVIIETLDGKIIEKDTLLLFKEDVEIASDYEKLILPRGYGGMFIINNKDVLYGYGSSNDAEKFGLKNKQNINYDEIIKLKDNVKRVFLSTDYNGSTSFIVTSDGKLFFSGYETDGEFKEINY